MSKTEEIANLYLKSVFTIKSIDDYLKAQQKQHLISPNNLETLFVFHTAGVLASIMDPSDIEGGLYGYERLLKYYFYIKNIEQLKFNRQLSGVYLGITAQSVWLVDAIIKIDHDLLGKPEPSSYNKHILDQCLETTNRLVDYYVENYKTIDKKVEQYRAFNIQILEYLKDIYQGEHGSESDKQHLDIHFQRKDNEFLLQWNTFSEEMYDFREYSFVKSTHPVKYIYFGKEHTLKEKSWVELYREVIQGMYHSHKTEFEKLIGKPIGEGVRREFSTDKKELLNPLQINDIFYLEECVTATYSLYILKWLIKKCVIGEDDLKVYLAFDNN